ncbi:glycosyltransferase [Sphingopyxis kveilinensis]|uniref:glycosyltransferase n=1 Tax=Sphingopyxis kveilinensis TaxID=3114367 RepID=UPI0030D4F20B
MKVLHVAETTIGGIASHLAEILPLQIEALGKGNVALLMPENEREHIAPFDGLALEYFRSDARRLRSAWTLSREMVRFGDTYRPDVVHAHSSFGGLAARLFGGAKGTPTIYCPHGWSFTQDISEWKKHIYGLVERAQLYQTSFVVNVSHYERKVALDYGLPDTLKLAVIENGIAASPPVSEQAQIVIDPDRINLAFIGRSGRPKGLDILLDAARQLEDEPIAFHLVGPSLEHDAPVLGDLPKNVIVYGWQPREFALAMLEKVDALVMPSRWEGLPMVGIEAMRASKPVIASKRSALPELVEDMVTGLLVDIDQPGSLASTLRGLSKTQLQRMGIAGRKVFERKYVAEKQIRKFLTLYERSMAA